MAKVATLADVATRASVSISTVSLVLRNKGNIPQETRQRVLDAAREVGYRVKTPPGKLADASGPLRTIAVIAKADAGDSPLVNPFYSQVIAGIEEACRQRNVNMLLAILPTDENNYPLEIPRVLAEDHAEGLLLIGAFVDHSLEVMLDQKEAPVILVDAYAPYRDYDSVVSDNYHGMYQAVSHLVRAGHRAIGLIGSAGRSFPSVEQRREGYLQALRDFSLESYCLDCWTKAELVREALEPYLRDHPEISAVIGVNDEVALMAVHVAQSLGRQVPQDLSVVGFDDIAMASSSRPGLTTMQVDKRGMGRSGLQLLTWRMQNPTLAPMTLMLHPRLIERESVSLSTVPSRNAQLAGTRG